MTTYGQKGGEGPTAGRKATVYAGRFPDGTKFKKRAFFATGSAFAAIYQGRDGKWYVAGIDQNLEGSLAAHGYTMLAVNPASEA